MKNIFLSILLVIFIGRLVLINIYEYTLDEKSENIKLNAEKSKLKEISVFVYGNKVNDFYSLYLKFFKCEVHNFYFFISPYRDSQSFYEIGKKYYDAAMENNMPLSEDVFRENCDYVLVKNDNGEHLIYDKYIKKFYELSKIGK